MITRTVSDPSGIKSFPFESLNAQWLKDFPYDKYRSCSVPLTGTIRLFEAITPNSTKDHKVWKAFEHFKAQTNHAHGTGTRGIKVTADLAAGSSELSACTIFDDRVFNYSTGYGQPGRYNSALSTWYSPRADGGFIPVPANLENLKFRGLQSMIPRAKSELKSLVSLYEIRDLLSLKGSIKNIDKLGKRLFASKPGRTYAEPLIDVVARQSADSYLQWMFNLRPIISDIRGIYHSIANYKRRIDDLVTRSGTRQVAHFKCNLAEQCGTTEDAWGPMVTLNPSNTVVYNGSARPLGSMIHFRRRITTDSAVFRCMMQYNYSYTAYQRENAYVLGLLDMLGVNFNPSYIWEVVPWSFVLDWVVDVGRWLDRYEIKNLEPKINILQYCWSIKKSRTISIDGKVRSWIYYGQTPQYPPQYLSFPEVRETSYRRGIDFPGRSSFETSGLSSTELCLGAALIKTRRRRHPRSP